MTDILDKIVSRHREDIASLGYTLGAAIPAERVRAAPIPFPAPLNAGKGVVLEIKRASPSKGDIAADLDAAKTAIRYAAAGASSISVLTEGHWFKGNLMDLQAAARAVDEYAAEHKSTPIAILRKDFLLFPEEVDVAYRSGADAVLLIARILSAADLTRMAQACQNLGMTAFIELREDDDLQKLAAVVSVVKAQYIVCGVNARDLRDFSIDLLTPAGLLGKIQQIFKRYAPDQDKNQAVRVIFESGIRSPEAASFASSLGFTAMLLGEAAAKNPEQAQNLVSAFLQAPATKNAAFWLQYAQTLRNLQTDYSPLVKICGLTNLADAKKAYELGADFLGFIFWEKSPRRTDEKTVRAVSREIRKLASSQGKKAPVLVGVIVEADSIDGKCVRRLVREGVLDCIQLHGCFHAFFDLPERNLPHYAAVNIADESDLSKIDSLRLQGEARILVDAHSALTPGGTGKRIADALVEKVAHKTKLWLAGGITPQNAGEICQRFQPEVIDVASGVEAEPGKKDYEQLKKLFAGLRAAP